MEKDMKQPVVTTASEDRILSPGQLVIRRFLRNKLAIAGMIILAIMILFSFFGPLFSPYGEYQMFYVKDGEVFSAGDEGYNINEFGVKVYDKASPTKEHPLGTDRDGRDILTRLMYGGRISIIIGIAAVAIELVIGVTMGGIAGYYGGKVDMVIMRVVDIFYCIPTLPVVLILSSALNTLKVPQASKIYFLMLLIGFMGWAWICRLVRGQILSLREQEYMVAAEAVGLRPVKRIFRHLLPNVMPQLIVAATLDIGSTILLESTLSFLGMGVQLPYASWGNMVNVVTDLLILRNHLSMWLPPGLCILVTVMAFNLIGDGLRDAFDPKMKR